MYKIKIITLLVLIVFLEIFTFAYKSTSKKEVSEEYKNFIYKCKKSDSRVITQCWADLITDATRKSGVDYAFSLFSKLYKEETTFASSCHDLAHVLGKESYYKIKNVNDLKGVVRTDFCSFGFYHGYLEVLLSKEGNLNNAVALCENMKANIGIKKSSLISECYHGIGHGATDYILETKENPKDAIKDGFEICGKVSKGDNFRLRSCYGGVFASVSDYLTTSKGSKFFYKDNPFYLCDSQSEYYKTCYQALTSTTMILNNSDFDKTIAVINEKLSGEKRDVAIATSAYILSKRSVKNTDFSEQVKNCQHLQYGNLACIKGFVYGLFAFTENYQYDKALLFCKSVSLSDQEKKECYNELLKRVGEEYAPSELNKFCLSIDENNYKDLCLKDSIKK